MPSLSWSSFFKMYYSSPIVPDMLLSIKKSEISGIPS